MSASAEPNEPGVMVLPEMPSSTQTEYPFEFHGDASEYFRIWIVNLALSIVTVGIYSAWAKVRTYRYFYSNTRVAGAPFEYLAQPIPILKGRLIALVLFGGYVFGGHISIKVQLGFAGLIALISPWLIVRGLRFHARYSAWRSLNFRFVGTYGDAYVRFLLMYLLVPISLFLAYPLVKSRQKKYVVEEHRYGGRAFAFHATDGNFYPPYLAGFGLGILWYAIVMAFLFSALFSQPSHSGHTPPPSSTIYSFVALVYAGIFAIGIYVSSRIVNLTYNNVELAGNRLRSTLRARDLIWIYLSNTVAILCSVGLLIPWAMIRLARYRAEHLTLLALGDLDEFVAVASTEESAIGAEMDSLFDVDIGL
jgi:uncharacterized membrane protein YjgN (DUF898 family)